MTRTSPVWLVLGSILSVQLGAAIAKTLFDDVGPSGMVWLRLVTSTLVFLVLIRPRVRGRTRQDWWAVLGYGASLGLMNWAIYQSFARIPLGLAVTLEFLGPLTVAVLGSRTGRDLIWAGLAGLGVLLLGLGPSDLDLLGVVFALLAGAGWAGYILTGKLVGGRWKGLDGLAVSSTIAALLVTGPALAGERGDIWRPDVVLIGVAVGLLSSVIPYSLELIALRRIPPRVFGILMSLEPAAAALAALLLLRETLSPVELLAMACVIVASTGAARSGQ
ncbi:EamA family transporter [Granulicoccus sp. GXG6511]|uniref:EamA family transporter n=1 Tax=Granulicoccus sp. GXG6511 TaxID=3381351 RepID=UPI003D7D03E5